MLCHFTCSSALLKYLRSSASSISYTSLSEIGDKLFLLFKITDFNNEIGDIIALIKEKNDSICDTALTNLKLSLKVLGGHEIDAEYKDEVDVNAINNKIEEKTLSLGLKDIENK